MAYPCVRYPQRRAIAHHLGRWLMGATLVAQVLTYWTHVSDRAFRVLVRMAVTALDKPQNGQQPGIYRGGRELLAMSLRSDKGTERTRNRAVAKAVAELTEAGAIQHLVTGWAGQNAVYRLTLGRVQATGSGRPAEGPMGGPKDHPMDVPRDHPMDGPSGTEWVVSETTPRNQEELPEERDEEEWAGLRTASHPPREPAEATNPESPPRSRRCPEHGLGGGLRADGLPECTFCRRDLMSPAPPEPDPPPPGSSRREYGPILATAPPSDDRLSDERIAPVIDLDSRRAS